MRVLTDSKQNDRVLELAGEYLTEYQSEISNVDAARVAAGASANADPMQIEALRCANSRYQLRKALNSASLGGEPLELSIVWAMYGETKRIQDHTEDNPHGEDFLRAKVKQMRWLADDLQVRWHLIAVDDGCPDRPKSSAQLARDIVKDDKLLQHHLGERVTVLELQEVLDKRTGTSTNGLAEALTKLTSTEQSRKGGSILYGLWHALHHQLTEATPKPQTHIVVYTDADLSTNLAQTGLLAAPILKGEASAVAGQRYGVDGAVLVTEDKVSVEPESTGSKPDSMIVLFRHLVRTLLMPGIANIIDTQAGFKAFDAKALSTAINHVDSVDETFDVELLLQMAKQRAELDDHGVGLAPIVFVEDFASSNFPSVKPTQRHLDMVKQLLSIYHRLVAPDADASAELQSIVDWLNELTLSGYVKAIDHFAVEYARVKAEGRNGIIFNADWPSKLLQQIARPSKEYAKRSASQSILT